MANTVLESQKDEVFYEANVNTLAGNSAVQFFFPPITLYNHLGQPVSEYVHIPDDKIVNVDVAYLKLDTYKDTEQDSTYNDGNFKDTNVAGAFYAIDRGDYFYAYVDSDTDNTAPSLERGTNKPRLAEIIDLPINSVGGTFENQTLGMFTPHVGRFGDLEAEGLNEGYKPNNMRMMAGRLEKFDAEDVSYRCFDQPTITTPNVNNDITNANALESKIDTDFLVENSNKFVNESSFYTPGDVVSAMEIVNVERDLSDFRYGDAEDEEALVFTGTAYVFTDTELTDVEAGNSLPINNIDVGGGDCYLGLHTFKLTDSTYSLSDPEKDITGDGGVAGNPNSQSGKWGWWFDSDADGANARDVSRPIPLKGVSQTVTVWLESEINPEMAELPPHKGYADASPYPIPDSAGQIRSSFPYYYSQDYVKGDDDKVLIPFSSFESDTTRFNSRAYYTDQKVYKSDVEGFDRVRAGNFTDLDETYGDISGFWNLKDDLVVFQERGVSVLPVGKNILEQADGGTIQVRSGEILGVPRYISTLYGTQDPKTIAGDGTRVYAIDDRNKVVFGYTPQGFDLISAKQMESYFASNLGGSTSDYLFAVYDTVNQQYMAGYRNNFAVMYDVRDNIWIGRAPNSATIQIQGGGIADGVLYLIMANTAGTEIGISQAEAGTYGKWGPDTGKPEFTVYMNPDPLIPKTFDVINWNADWTPTELDITVPQQASVASQTALTFDISSLMGFREGTYRLSQQLRATDATYTGERFRGMLMEITSRFPQNQTGRVSSIAVKYRPSHRAI